MEPVYHKLPIRLVPRTDFSIAAVVMLSIMSAMGIGMVLIASGTIEALNRRLDYHGSFEARLVFSIFCGLFAVGFLCALVKSGATLLPGSPSFHLQVSGRGIVMRNVPRSRTYAWSELSGFRVVRRERRRKRNYVVYYYVNAVAPELVGKLLDDDPFYAQPIFSLSADEFGANDDEMDARSLAEWLNELRELALKGELKDGDSVSSPPGFESVTSSMAGQRVGPPAGAPTIVRRQ